MKLLRTSWPLKKERFLSYHFHDFFFWPSIILQNSQLLNIFIWLIILSPTKLVCMHFFCDGLSGAIFYPSPGLFDEFAKKKPSYFSKQVKRSITALNANVSENLHEKFKVLCMPSHFSNQNLDQNSWKTKYGKYVNSFFFFFWNVNVCYKFN